MDRINREPHKTGVHSLSPHDRTNDDTRQQFPTPPGPPALNMRPHRPPIELQQLSPHNARHGTTAWMSLTCSGGRRCRTLVLKHVFRYSDAGRKCVLRYGLLPFRISGSVMENFQGSDSALARVTTSSFSQRLLRDLPLHSVHLGLRPLLHRLVHDLLLVLAVLFWPFTTSLAVSHTRLIRRKRWRVAPLSR